MMRLLLPLLLCGFLRGGEYVVVVAAGESVGKQVSSATLSALFLKKRAFLEEMAVVPVNLSASDPVRLAFEKAVLEVPREELNDYWIEQHYRGVSPPVVQRSQNGVKAFLRNVPGAVGYIEKANLEPGLTVLHEF